RQMLRPWSLNAWFGPVDPCLYAFTLALPDHSAPAAMALSRQRLARMIRQSVSGLAIRSCANLTIWSAIGRKTAYTFADRAPCERPIHARIARSRDRPPWPAARDGGIPNCESGRQAQGPAVSVPEGFCRAANRPDRDWSRPPRQIPVGGSCLGRGAPDASGHVGLVSRYQG